MGHKHTHILTVLALMSLTLSARAQTVTNITQSTNHATIQEAVDNAVDGDVIELGAGTFLESGITIDGVDLTLRGQGQAQAIIDPNYAGRALLFANTDSTVVDLTVRQGSDANGSAVYVQSNANIVLNHVTIADSADTAISDLGVNSTIKLEYCRLLNNQSANAFDSSVYRGIGTTVFVNCLFEGNSGGSSTIGSQFNVKVVNCTFVRNTDTYGVEKIFSGAATVQNSVFDDAYSGSAVSAGVAVTHSLYPGAGGSAGNVDGVPVFLDPDQGDYTLSGDGLGVDAAGYYELQTAGGIDFDFNGNPRVVDALLIIDSGIGLLNYLDMGAFEVQPGDADADGVPDASDRCSGFNDKQDENNNGAPDACEVGSPIGLLPLCDVFFPPNIVEAECGNDITVVDYEIWSPGELRLKVKGGDGGGVQIGSATGGTWEASCTIHGGQGATAQARFIVGDGPGELAPGGTLRFIAGSEGDWDSGDNPVDKSFGASGGGGSAVLYAPPGSISQQDWIILMVAGGGGGSQVNVALFSCSGTDYGDDGSLTTCGTNGNGNNSGHGGCNGNGGEGSADGSGGGGAFTDGGPGSLGANRRGQAGYPDGGIGDVNTKTCVNLGYGFGGGGGGGERSGGGGGGYSGGGAGGRKGAGGGGGSYINPDYALPDSKSITIELYEESTQGYIEWESTKFAFDRPSPAYKVTLGSTYTFPRCLATPSNVPTPPDPDTTSADVWFRLTSGATCSAVKTIRTEHIDITVFDENMQVVDYAIAGSVMEFQMPPETTYRIVLEQLFEDTISIRFESSDLFDDDFDGILNLCDNCPSTPNANQKDNDNDGNGNVCDICPGHDDYLDSDGDGVPNGCDACHGYDDNVDSDGDGVADGCDLCPDYDDNSDQDGDGQPDDCDPCPNDNPDDLDGNGGCGAQVVLNGVLQSEVPETGALLPFSGFLTCDIDLPQTYDFWTFDANAGDVINLSVTRIDPELDPLLTLWSGNLEGTPLFDFAAASINPNQTFLALADDEVASPFVGNDGADPALVGFVAPSTGTYTVLVAGRCQIPTPNDYTITLAINTNAIVTNVTADTIHATLQDALDNATTGDEIEISAGTLFEDYITFPLGLDVTVRGAGRDLTFIDASLSTTNQAMLVLRDTGQTNATVISDLTLINGINTSTGVNRGATAGIWIRDTSPVFERVDAVDPTGPYTVGYAHMNVVGANAAPFFRDCRFLGGRGLDDSAIDGIGAFLDAHVNMIQCQLPANSNTIRTALLTDGATCEFLSCTIPGRVDFANGWLNMGNTIISEIPALTQTTLTAEKCLYPGATGDNIDGVPTFVDPNNGDFRLAAGSLGIDAGNYIAYLLVVGGSIDLIGAARTFDDPSTANTGSGPIPYLDLGAYEFYTDGDGDGVNDQLDACPDFDDSIDADRDGLPDQCDPCPSDPNNDSDGDGVCDSVDVCLGGDDTVDTDGDGVADFCDVCPFDNPNDSDGDGVCDSDDLCPDADDSVDSDSDGVPDVCDVCPLDSPDDADGDGLCDSEDPCPIDNPNDSDGDGVCDSLDACPGGDDSVDTDGDGVANFCDPCRFDNPDDSDGDGVCDAGDTCVGGDDNDDLDADGLPDFCDPCISGEGTGDTNGDGLVDVAEFTVFEGCLTGPLQGLGLGCECFDIDNDVDDDVADYAGFQTLFTGP